LAGGIIGSTSTHSASVRSLGYRRPCRTAARRRSGFHISAPPVDDSGAAQGTYGPPRRQVVCTIRNPVQSATTYPASERCSRPRWRSAQPGPHNHSGLAGRSLSQVSVLPFRLSGHLALTTRRHRRSISDNYHRIRPNPSHALTACAASNRPPRANTAQAICASLLASATTTIFLWARANSPCTQRPSGVSR
jgi:hypothetical protein